MFNSNQLELKYITKPHKYYTEFNQTFLLPNAIIINVLQNPKTAKYKNIPQELLYQQLISSTKKCKFSIQCFILVFLNSYLQLPITCTIPAPILTAYLEANTKYKFNAILRTSTIYARTNIESCQVRLLQQYVKRPEQQQLKTTPMLQIQTDLLICNKDKNRQDYFRNISMCRIQTNHYTKSKLFELTSADEQLMKVVYIEVNIGCHNTYKFKTKIELIFYSSVILETWDFAKKRQY
eukprot:TRINITY_DN3629_c1_g1_i7.p2 TRINITY_DN3629_c1_g1~~TRINITY_DN3629_c1_g1_i7.p2  ORF type:complete len:237 (+),score=-13.61 TRINITY_DN3629_c1_g1_i7:132-842(+)